MKEKTEKKDDLNIPPQEVLDLISIRNKFNNDLKEWSEKTGCVASFQWNYVDNKQLDIKAVESLDLTSVDKILYRKPPPSEDDFKNALGNLNGIKVSK